jgi:hypothetical protein
MDFVTVLDDSTASGYTRMHDIGDRLIKMAIYLPCPKDIDSPEWAWLFFAHIICRCGIPANIVTDRGTHFTSGFWTWECSHLSTDHHLSTAFHRQIDGQTELQNQMMEQYLQAFYNYEPDNWVAVLPLAEFAYNHAIHASMGMIPFCANYHHHPAMHFKPLNQRSSLNSEIQAHSFTAGLEETDQTLCKTMQEAQAN